MPPMRCVNDRQLLRSLALTLGRRWGGARGGAVSVASAGSRMPMCAAGAFCSGVQAELDALI
eukprot:5687844-Pyramimonas_sp.AAC.1